MNQISQQIVPEIFKRHIGTWKGEYIKTDTKGHFQSSFLGTFTIEIQGTTYQQVNQYEFPDGKQVTLNFEGEFINGILTLNSTSYFDFQAIAWDSGENTIAFRANKTQHGKLITFIETVNLLAQNHRVRSTQVFKDGVFNGISFIEETRLSQKFAKDSLE